MKKRLRKVVSMITAVSMIMCSFIVLKSNSYEVIASEKIILNDETGIPDTNLYQKVLKKADMNKDGILTRTEAEAVTEIDAAYADISNIKGIEYLSNLQKLKLAHNQITDIRPLAALEKLTMLRLRENQIEDISSIGNMSSLEWLDLGQNSIEDISTVGNLINVWYLALDGNSIKDISSLAALPKLKNLYIRGNQIGDLSPIRGILTLKDLDASENGITDIEPVSTLTQLIDLTLMNNQIEDLEPLRNLSKLWGLDLTGNSISDLSPLSSLANLELLALGHNQISDFSPLNKLDKIKNVILSHNLIKEVTELSVEAERVELRLDHNQIEDISPLKSASRNISMLGLSGNKISDVSALTEIVSDRAVVDLSNNNISVIPDDWKDSALMEYWIRKPFQENNFWEDYFDMPSLVLKGNPITWEEATAKLPAEVLYSKSPTQQVFWFKMQSFVGCPEYPVIPTPTPTPTVTTNISGPSIEYHEGKKKDITTWDCVYFGEYPQSEVTSGEAVFEQLQQATEWENDEVTIDGERYLRTKQPLSVFWNSAYCPDYFAGSDGHSAYPWDYSADELVGLSEDDLPYHYFQYEPIKWRVLQVEDNKALLLSDKILENQMYQWGMNPTLGYEEKVAWENSQIRAMLNGYGDYQQSQNSFVQKAFGSEEWNAILPATDVSGDAVFLLSEEEIKKMDSAGIYEKSMVRTAVSTDYAWAYGCYRVNSSDPMTKNTSNWWLRNDDYSYNGNSVLFTGACNRANLSDSYTGIRPALYLDLSSDAYEYAGKVSTDYQLYADLDQDDKVSIQDAQRILKLALHVEVSDDENLMRIADVDGDGVVNLQDAQRALQMSLKIAQSQIMDS